MNLQGLVLCITDLLQVHNATDRQIVQADGLVDLGQTVAGQARRIVSLRRARAAREWVENNWLSFGLPANRCYRGISLKGRLSCSALHHVGKVPP